MLREDKILISKSLAVDQERTTIATLIDALFFDLTTEGEAKIPRQAERRERELRTLFKNRLQWPPPLGFLHIYLDFRQIQQREFLPQ